MENTTRGMQYKEAIERMRKLRLMPVVLEDFNKDIINKSERMGPFLGMLHRLNYKEKEFVRKWEEKSGNLAYHVIKDITEMGVMRSILYVSKHKDEWEADRSDLDEGRAIAYGLIGFDEMYGEYGSIGVMPANGGLKRTF